MNATSLLHLPDETLIHIIHTLQDGERMALSRACKRLLALVKYVGLCNLTLNGSTTAKVLASLLGGWSAAALVVDLHDGNGAYVSAISSIIDKSGCSMLRITTVHPNLQVSGTLVVPNRVKHLSVEVDSPNLVITARPGTMLKGVNVVNAAVFGAKMPPAREVRIGKYLCMGPPVCHVNKRCEMLTLGAPIRHLGVSSEYSNIRKLKMDNMDQGSIDAIACLQQLEVLSIGDSVMGGRLATGISLPHFPKLRKVCAPTYTSVKGLARCGRLTKLWVNRLSRTDAVLERLVSVGLAVLDIELMKSLKNVKCVTVAVTTKTSRRRWMNAGTVLGTTVPALEVVKLVLPFAVHEDRFNVSQTRGAFRWWDCGELAAEFVAKLPAVTHLDMYGYFTSEAIDVMFLHATFPERLRHLHVCPAVEADTMSDMLEKLVSFFPRLHTLDVMFDTTDIQLGVHVKMSVLPFFRPLRMYRSMAVRFRNTENVTWVGAATGAQYMRPCMTSVTTYPRLENRQARDLVAFSRGRVDVYCNSHGKESAVYTGSTFHPHDKNYFSRVYK